MALCYIASFGALARAVRGLEVGVAYAIWAGAGTALVAGVGVLHVGETLTIAKALSLALIIVGVAGLQFTST